MYEYVDGRLVSSEQLNIAEIIRDYDPNLELCWIPPEIRTNEDAWAVFHTHQGNRYLVKTFADCDHRILAYLWDNDVSRTNVISRIDAENKAREAVRLKAELEASEMRQDLVASVIKSPLHRYKLPNGKVIEDHGERIRGTS